MADNDVEQVAARVGFVTAIGAHPRSIRKGAVYASDHPIVIGNPTRFGPVDVHERPGTAGAAALRQTTERVVAAVPAVPSEVDQIAELMTAHRDELDSLAKAAGVENPEGLPNREAVATAILEVLSREPDAPIVGGLEGGAGHPATAPLNGAETGGESDIGDALGSATASGDTATGPADAGASDATGEPAGDAPPPAETAKAGPAGKPATGAKAGSRRR